MIQSKFKIKRTALITGAAQGIGKAIALKLIRNGDSVIITDVDSDKLKKTVEEIKKISSDCSSYIVDVSKPDEIKKVINLIVNDRGRIDILINNAGIAAFGGIEDVTNEILDKMIDVNFKGAFYLCREIAPIMKKQHYGKIVNISSITAKRGDNTTMPCYGPSKGALIVLTKSLAKQLGPFGININAVAPHAIDTSIMELWDDEKREKVAKALPVKRIGKPDDVASAVLFLVSDESSFITGHVINVDGGHFMDS